MKILEDHLQRTVMFAFPPRRIISLCPSITETLYAMQLSSQIVGRTRYCIHPVKEVDQAAIVGGTKEVNEEVIAQLKPDLIIAEKEENPKQMIDQLAARYPVYVTNVENYTDALKMISDLGVICGREEQTKIITKEIKEKFQGIESTGGLIKVAYLIWKKPYMAAGHSTFIHSVLESCGLMNVFMERQERYPTVTLDDIRQAKPDIILLSSEPYPFKDRDKDEFMELVPGAKTILVDGEMFSWYGVRMIDAAPYLNQLVSQLKSWKM